MRAMLVLAVMMTGCLQAPALRPVETLPTALAQLPPERDSVVRHPTRVMRHDGSVVLFAQGARLGPAGVVGNGQAYDVGMTPLGYVHTVPIETIATIVSFQGKSNPVGWLTSIGVTAAVSIGLLILSSGGIGR